MIGICTFCGTFSKLAAHHYCGNDTVVLCYGCHRRLHGKYGGKIRFENPSGKTMKKDPALFTKKPHGLKLYTDVQITPAMVEIVKRAGYLGIGDFTREAIREKLNRDYPGIVAQFRMGSKFGISTSAK